jgi:hypothetical protein
MRAITLLKVVRFFAIIMLCGFLPQGGVASELQETKVRDERKVTLQVTDVPLNEVLSILAKNVPLEIRGTVPSQDRITAQFSNLSLEEALSRIMRGYNYVLVRPDESVKPLLVVMNKIQRPIQNEPASAGPVPSPVALPGAAPTQMGQPQPGMPQAPPAQEPGVLPARVGPAETGQAGPQRPGYQPGFPGAAPSSGPAPSAGPVPTFPSMPGGPLGPGAVPQGMPGGPASAPGGVPPGIFPPPGAINPPPGGADTGGPQPAPPLQPQQSTQPTPEPARIMTPFGERAAE